MIAIDILTTLDFGTASYKSVIIFVSTEAIPTIISTIFRVILSMGEFARP